MPLGEGCIVTRDDIQALYDSLHKSIRVKVEEHYKIFSYKAHGETVFRNTTSAYVSVMPNSLSVGVEEPSAPLKDAGHRAVADDGMVFEEKQRKKKSINLFPEPGAAPNDLRDNEKVSKPSTLSVAVLSNNRHSLLSTVPGEVQRKVQKKKDGAPNVVAANNSLINRAAVLN